MLGKRANCLASPRPVRLLTGWSAVPGTTRPVSARTTVCRSTSGRAGASRHHQVALGGSNRDRIRTRAYDDEAGRPGRVAAAGLGFPRWTRVHRRHVVASAGWISHRPPRWIVRRGGKPAGWRSRPNLFGRPLRVDIDAAVEAVERAGGQLIDCGERHAGLSVALPQPVNTLLEQQIRNMCRKALPAPCVVCRRDTTYRGLIPTFRSMRRRNVGP